MRNGGGVCDDDAGVYGKLHHSPALLAHTSAVGIICTGSSEGDRVINYRFISYFSEVYF